MQCLVVATLALLVGSLATIAVPKLAGSLIDVCIQYNQEGGRDAAKRHVNTMLYEILGILAVGGVATGIRSWCACIFPVSCQYARNWHLQPVAFNWLRHRLQSCGCLSVDCTCEPLQAVRNSRFHDILFILGRCTGYSTRQLSASCGVSGTACSRGWWSRR